MSTGWVLTARQAIYSPNGQYQLIMQGDGNLVEYGQGGEVIWDSVTWQPGPLCDHAGRWQPRRLQLRRDGAWDSGTYGNAGASFQLQDNGNAVIYQANGTALWYGNSTACRDAS